MDEGVLSIKKVIVLLLLEVALFGLWWWRTTPSGLYASNDGITMRFHEGVVTTDILGFTRSGTYEREGWFTVKLDLGNVELHGGLNILNFNLSEINFRISYFGSNVHEITLKKVK